MTESKPEPEKVNLITDSKPEQTRQYTPAYFGHVPRDKRKEGVHFISGSFSTKNSPPNSEE